MKVGRPPVVTKTIPTLAHLGAWGGCERLYGGVLGQEPMIVALDTRHLCLLEHELRDKHVVRIARPTPGEIAAVTPEPAENAPAKFRGVAMGHDQRYSA